MFMKVIYSSGAYFVPLPGSFFIFHRCPHLMKSQFLWKLLRILHAKMPGEGMGEHKTKGWVCLRAHQEAFPADGYSPAIPKGLQRGDRVPPVERPLGLCGSRSRQVLPLLNCTTGDALNCSAGTSRRKAHFLGWGKIN